MPRWQLLTEVALLLLVALLVLAAAGVAVPLFRALLAFAVILLALGALWRALMLLRATPRPVDGNGQAPVAGSRGRRDS